MNEIISANQKQIDQLQGDPLMMDQIHQQYDQQANVIIEDNPDILP
ncbi:MAG TPA: hypothetical protein VFO76_01980 [Candidatus Kapabacteria bacterium]|nr:hypothetical protein [Candidatus Kapabacteria bacterium]